MLISRNDTLRLVLGGIALMKIKGIVIYSFWKLIFYFLFLIGKYRKQERNLLIVDIQAIRDSIMASPIIKNLRENVSNNCMIDIVCSGIQKPIYERFVEIDNIYVIHSFEEYYLKNRKKFLGRDLYKIQYSFYVFKYVLNNLINKYNVVIEPRWEEDTVFTSILIMLIGAKNRYGFSEKVNKNKARRNFWRDKYFTKCFLHEAACYEGDKFLDLIEDIGYHIKTRKVKLSYNHSTSYNDMWGEYAVLALDTSDNRKEWDCDNFITTAQYIIESGLSVVLLGVKTDNGDYVYSKIASNNCFNYVGKTTLSEAIDIIGNSSFYIGCDTGLSHIAGSVGVPGIAIFPNSKLENPESVSSVTRLRPSRNTIVIQPDLPLYPCTTDCLSKGKAHCINEVKPEDVIMVIEHLLKI